MHMHIKIISQEQNWIIIKDINLENIKTFKQNIFLSKYIRCHKRNWGIFFQIKKCRKPWTQELWSQWSFIARDADSNIQSVVLSSISYTREGITLVFRRDSTGYVFICKHSASFFATLKIFFLGIRNLFSVQLYWGLGCIQFMSSFSVSVWPLLAKSAITKEHVAFSQSSSE